jgi:hypothetical protein
LLDRSLDIVAIKGGANALLDCIRKIDPGKQVRELSAHTLGDRLFQLLRVNSTGIPPSMKLGRAFTLGIEWPSATSGKIPARAGMATGQGPC